MNTQQPAKPNFREAKSAEIANMMTLAKSELARFFGEHPGHTGAEYMAIAVVSPSLEEATVFGGKRCDEIPKILRVFGLPMAGLAALRHAAPPGLLWLVLVDPETEYFAVIRLAVGVAPKGVPTFLRRVDCTSGKPS